MVRVLLAQSAERGGMTDIAVTHRTSTEREDQHASEQADKAAREADCTCEFCHKVFVNAWSRRRHRAMYHARRLAKIASRSRRVGAGVGAVIDLKEQE